MSASDFVHITDLAITIQNQTFPHFLYHFVLTYSNWDGDGLFLGEFRKPVRRVSEHDLGMFLSRQGIRLLDFLQPLKERASMES